MSGVPYIAGPFTLECVGGERSCHTLSVPWRAVITGFVFTQTDGVLANCDFELFMRSIACQPSNSSEALPSELTCARELCTVFGVKNYTAGVTLAEYAQNYPYVNQDGNVCDAVNELYLELTPAGSGLKTYELSLRMLTSKLQ